MLEKMSRLNVFGEPLLKNHNPKIPSFVERCHCKYGGIIFGWSPTVLEKTRRLKDVEGNSRHLIFLFGWFIYHMFRNYINLTNCEVPAFWSHINIFALGMCQVLSHLFLLYGLFTYMYIWFICMENAGKYTIHGCYMSIDVTHCTNHVSLLLTLIFLHLRYLQRQLAGGGVFSRYSTQFIGQSLGAMIIGWMIFSRKVVGL